MMRRWVWLALLSAACSQNTGFSRGSLSGAQDLAMTDDYAFVTSADTNDLRVLQLDVPNSTQRTYYKAPNPLESLSIPTINRPTALVVDDRWVNGRVAHGRYVYVSSAGAAALSVVGADPTEFREVARLVTPAPVTQTTAVTLDDDTSRVYFATYDGEQGRLFLLDLPKNPSVLRGYSALQLASLIKVVASFGRDSVAALLIVPPATGRTNDGTPFCDSGNHCVVVATRRAGGAEGETLMLDPVSLRTARLGFPGPVRYLATHGQTVRALDDGSEVPAVGAGQRVFAILDEEKCGSASCGGVMAVDAQTAVSATGGFPISIDGKGLPMLPLSFSDSLPVGLAIAANATLQASVDGPKVTRLASLNDNGGEELRAYSALGVVTSANGQVTFFDADRLLQIDGNFDQARAQNAQFFDPNGFQAEYITGLDAGMNSNQVITTIAVADGVWRSQLVKIYWEGEISDTAIAIDGAATTLEVPSTIRARLELGDIVVFQNEERRCADAPIIALSETSLTLASVPTDCTRATSFLILAGPNAPFAIFKETLPRYLGRASPGEEFIWHQAPSVRLSGFEFSQPALRMGFGLDTVAKPPARGSLWQFSISSGYAPYTFLIDLNVQCSMPPRLPGHAVFDERRSRFYVVYPSSNSVIDIDPGNAQRVTVGTGQNTYCYH